MKVLVTCPPMLGMIDSFLPLFNDSGIELTAPKVVQTMSIDELIKLVPIHDGWIIGDDIATREVFKAGKVGNLKAVVKWGIGIDNVDLDACKDFNIQFTNTPNMFGSEVADIAVGYVVALARQTFIIDRGVRQGEWPKPIGISLSGKTAALIGYGDVGKNTAKRLLAADMKVIYYDPSIKDNKDLQFVQQENWPNRIEDADFIIVTCSLTKSSYHMINDMIFKRLKKGVRIVNVGRGPVIDESSLKDALISGIVHSVALDVFEEEPLPLKSYLRNHPNCIFGSHNASNTKDAVKRTSEIAIKKILEFLNDN